MNRDFAILGLREDATKAQVKAAYEKRLAKYSSADFADDPEYVRKKSAELASAYRRAYAVAGTSAASESSIPQYREAPRSSERKETSRRDERREARRSDERRTKPLRRKKPIDEAERPKVDFDLQKLQGKAKEKTKEWKTEFVEQINLSKKDKTKSSKGAESKISLVISIAVILFGLFGFFTDQDDSSDWEDEYEEPYTYTYEYSLGEDEQIHQLALTATDKIFDLDFESSYYVSSYTDEDLVNVSTKFAKRYLGADSVAEKANQLYYDYMEFPHDGGGDLFSTVTEILSFYGFPDLAVVEGYINEYNGETITNTVEYLRYLNQYYYYELRENKKGA